MGRKKTHTPEEIVAKLRQAEVVFGQGKPVADAVRRLDVSERKACAVLGRTGRRGARRRVGRTTRSR